MMMLARFETLVLLLVVALLRYCLALRPRAVLSRGNVHISEHPDQDKNRQDPLFAPLQERSRRDFFSTSAAALTTALFSPCLARADEIPTSIAACSKPADAGAPNNCISTSSVRQVDLYMPPWTIREGTSQAEAMARLKGVISLDKSLTIQQETENYLKVTASRNFNTDELEFLINTADNVIFFRSQQVDGPSVTDFGSNRKRLEDLRRSANVFGVMGEDFETADVAPREGAVGQLKAFYGLKMGEGFEDLE